MDGNIVNYNKINNECFCFNLRKITRSVTQLYDLILDPTGIRATQLSLLAALASTNTRTLTDVSRILVMDRTTLTRNLKPIEKLGLIESVKTSDKRAKSYKLSEKGKLVLHNAINNWNKAQSLVLSKWQSIIAYEDLLTELDKVTNSVIDLTLISNTNRKRKSIDINNQANQKFPLQRNMNNDHKKD